MQPRAGSRQSVILKTDRILEQLKDKLPQTLNNISRINFWKTHFTNHNYRFEGKDFDWNNHWQNIPFFTLKDFELIGLQTRLADAEKLVQDNTKRFLLETPFRKVNKQHILFLDSLVSQKKLKKKKKGKFSNREKPQDRKDSVSSSHTVTRPFSKGWRIQLIESYGLNLRQVLMSFKPKTKKKLLIVDPRIIKSPIQNVLEEITISSVYTDPQHLETINDIFKDKKIQKTIKKIVLTRWVKKGSNLENMENLRNAKLTVEHPFVGIGMALKHCNFVQKRHTPNAVHPKKFAIVELINTSATGLGEIVITNLKPNELALIRYRTGIIGKAFFERCRCGSNWVLIINHIKKFQFKSKLLKN